MPNPVLERLARRAFYNEPGDIHGAHPTPAHIARARAVVLELAEIAEGQEFYETVVWLQAIAEEPTTEERKNKFCLECGGLPGRHYLGCPVWSREGLTPDLGQANMSRRPTTEGGEG